MQCTGPPQGVFDATATIGEPIAKAQAAAREKGCEIRIVIKDGKPLAVTDDYRPDRVNVATVNDKVTRITGIH